MKHLLLFSLLFLTLISCSKENPLAPLDLRGKLSGTITDQFGAALAGVNIGTDGSHDAVSGSDGVFTISDIEPGSYSLTFSKGGYFDTTFDTTIAIAKEQEDITVDMVLYKIVGSISGFVSDSVGDPLTDVAVTMTPVAGSPGEEKSINTGTDGAFQVNDMALGIYEIQATHAFYTAQSTPRCTLNLNNYHDSVALTMIYSGEDIIKTGTVTGVIQSGEGNVPALTEWRVSLTNGDTTISVSGETSEKSVSYSISPVPVGSWRVIATDLKHLADSSRTVTVEHNSVHEVVTIILEDEGAKFLTRTVSGQFEQFIDRVDSVHVEFQSEDDTTWVSSVCDYNVEFGTYTGVINVPEKDTLWKVRVKSYQYVDEDLRKIGQSEPVEMSKSSGDIRILDFPNPTNAMPRPKFILQPYSSVNMPITMSGSGSDNFGGTVVSYSWDFGDGNTGTGKSVEHTYTEAGQYTVRMTITDDDNNASVASSTISIRE